MAKINAPNFYNPNLNEKVVAFYRSPLLFPPNQGAIS
jgi:hypothetical protein